MSEPDTNLPHITTTETLVRFYVLLAQYIDRCMDEATKRSLPEGEFQKHLARDTHPGDGTSRDKSGCEEQGGG